MFKVNNKKTITLLAKSSFKANRLRNLFAVVAIILTTVLFTGLFTIAASLIASMEESTMRQVGGSFHGGFKCLTEEQYDVLKAHPSIKTISYSVVLGVAENPELSKRPTEIRYTNDEINAKGMFAMPTTGRLPQSDNELATDTLVLERLGIPAELGQQVTITYSVGEKQHTETFTLVGFWQGDQISMASMVWLNRSYVEKQLENYKPKHARDAIGKINADVNFSNARGIEEKLHKVILDSGFSLDEIDYGVNWAYTGNQETIEVGTVLSAVAAILMIAFCGYLMIANVFTISVANDVRHYGLIKTIGTTPKQIRRIIRKQALRLCTIGVPLGLLAGYAVGVLLIPVAFSVLNLVVMKVSANPLLFILAGLFSVFTVVVSIAKPSKIAAKVSPIEALRTTDSNNAKRKAKNGTKVSLWSMARANIGRNKKKALLVTVSLSLGLILLNVTYSVANSFNMDGYLERMIGSDFAVGDVSNFNVHLDYINQDTLSPKFFEELSLQNGISAINKIYFSEPGLKTDPRFADIPAKFAAQYPKEGDYYDMMQKAAQNPITPTHIYGLDSGVFDRLTVLKGNIDTDKLLSGNYVIAEPFESRGEILYYDIGDTIELPNTDGKMKEYEVLAIANIPYNISAQHSHPLTPTFYLPSEVFLSQIEEKTPMLTTIDVEDYSIEQMESFLANYCSDADTNMGYQSKETLATEYEGTQKTFKIIGITLSTIIALVGIMNFINTVITSIITRKRELAMLQSIGMASKQVRMMLILESTLYILLTLTTVLTIGSVLCCFGLNAFVAGNPYMKFFFTVVPSLLCVPILMFIGTAVSILCQKAIAKNSIVERLREVD